MKDTPNIGNSPAADAKRDAVHVAVAPVRAGGQYLYPGNHVGVADGIAVVGTAKTVGVVDPFLTKPVPPHELFWLFLYPNTVTGLRHDWTHPNFDAALNLPAFADVVQGEQGAGPVPDKAESETWLRRYAERMNHYFDDPERAYQFLLEGLRDGELSAYGSDLHSYSDLDDADELEKHAGIVLGRKINLRDFSFSCSC